MKTLLFTIDESDEMDSSSLSSSFSSASSPSLVSQTTNSKRLNRHDRINMVDSCSQVMSTSKQSNNESKTISFESIGRFNEFSRDSQQQPSRQSTINKTKLHRPHYNDHDNHYQFCDTSTRMRSQQTTNKMAREPAVNYIATLYKQKLITNTSSSNDIKTTVKNNDTREVGLVLKIKPRNKVNKADKVSPRPLICGSPVDLLKRRSNIYLLYTIYTILSLFCSTQQSESLLIKVRSRDEPFDRQTTAATHSRSSPSSQLDTNKIKMFKSNSTRSAKLLEVDAFGYLQRYGYVNESMGNANLISEESFSDAIMTFQRFAGIQETGTIDSETIKYMQMPRCGNKDMSGKGENGKRKRRRRKRYALQGSKWRRQELTYRISQYPTRFINKKHEVDKQIERAFKIWSQVAPIDFVVKQDGRVHIDIRFASGEHGDGDPFDGPGNTLAHAYFPQYGGDAHFDDQEYWTVDSYAGTNIFQVAAHELGHSLGLGHSSVREALMAPFYQKYKPNFKLHPDDVLGIQALYGERLDGDSSSSTSTSTTTSTTTTSTTSTPDDSHSSSPRRPSGGDAGNGDEGGWFGFGGSGSSKPVDLCQDSAIDAITRTEDGNTYVFRGAYYWQIKNEGLASGFPAKISRDWDGLPGNLDAALTWSDGKTFFFKGDKYWRFFNKRREPGYPKQISVGFAGIPNNIDAAFVWGGNGKTYFFKRDKYWRFDSKQDPPVSSQYPKSIRNWGGLPTQGIDGAFKWENGMTYFFKDDLYYRFDDREFEVDTSARPAFPRSTAEWWYGCTNSNLPLRNRPVGSLLGSNSQINNQISASQIDQPKSDQDQFRSTSSSSLSNNQRDDDQLAIGPSIKPRGNSLSRSILNSLSFLFPSSPSPSNSSPSGSLHSSPGESRSSIYDDWSFHRGLGEEVNRVFRAAGRSINHQKPTGISFSNVDPRKTESSLVDNSRWTFPFDSRKRFIGGINREESLSELRAHPDESISNDDDHSNDSTTKDLSSSSHPSAEKEHDKHD